MTKSRGDHYLPASLIGGFGTRSDNPKRLGLRYSTIAVRFAGTDESLRRTAETVAKKVNTYALSMPPPGLDRNAIDSLWDEYEPELPGAIRDFEAGTYKADGWSVLLAHVTALGVRHPDFERIAAQFLTERGEIRIDRDELQRQRVHTLSETPALLAECRFALIRRPDDGPRFIINDKGYTTVETEFDGRKGILFPLSGEIALLAAVGVGADPTHPRAWLSRQGTFTPGTVGMFNKAAWRQVGIGCVIGHPNDAVLLDGLVDGPLTVGRLGPFRNRPVEGMFDWAHEE